MASLVTRCRRQSAAPIHPLITAIAVTTSVISDRELIGTMASNAELGHSGTKCSPATAELTAASRIGWSDFVKTGQTGSGVVLQRTVWQTTPDPVFAILAISTRPRNAVDRKR